MAAKEHARKQIKKFLKTVYYLDKFDEGLEKLKPKLKSKEYSQIKQQLLKIHKEMEKELKEIKA